jgi:hypothetical protein
MVSFRHRQRGTQPCAMTTTEKSDTAAPVLSFFLTAFDVQLEKPWPSWVTRGKVQTWTLSMHLSVDTLPVVALLHPC